MSNASDAQPITVRPEKDPQKDANIIKKEHLENLVYHLFRQLWLVLGVKLMEINSNWFSRHHHPKCHACVVLMFAFEGHYYRLVKKNMVQGRIFPNMAGKKWNPHH